ncbi:MAG: SPFH domain-containing protein [Aeromicrobium sp.]
MTIIAIAGIAVLVVLLVATIVTRYKVAGPNEAFIITGRRDKGTADNTGQKVVVGGGAFIIPFVQSMARLPLSSNQITLQVSNAPSSQGISLNVTAVAVVKVGGDEEHIRAAAQRFLGQTEAIHSTTTEVLEAELRAIVGSLSVEEIIRERAAFASKVAEAGESSLSGQGLVLDSFSIKDVSDAGGGTYLRDLGRPEAALIKQKADIAEAEAHQISEQSRLAADEQVAIANRTLALKQAEIKAETDKASAEADAAGPLAKAARDQEVLTQQALVAERQADVKEKQLEIDVRKPADAERYRIEQAAEAARNAEVSRAEGARTAKVATAEAEKASRIALAEAAAIEGEKTGQAEKSRRALIAEAVQLEGESEAKAIEAVGKAEASAMSAKSESYKEYGEAAILEMMVNKLPEVARELAAPMGNIDTLTVVSTDGASALPKALADNMTQVMELFKTVTGTDLSKLISGVHDSAPAAVNGASVPDPR